MDVELRHLRALVAVADELNFTRAAERLHLTQQALSRQIHQLEQRVGTRLVDRDTRRVALTPAGEELCERARVLLTDAAHAVRAARTAGGTRRVVTLGVVAPLTLRLLGSAMRRFAERHADTEVVLHFGSFLDPCGGLRDEASDVAVVYGEFDTTGLDLWPLFSEPRGVAIAAGHPLAAAQTVSLRDFLAQPLVDVPMTDPLCRDYWTAARHREGRPARIGAVVQTLDGLIEAIGAGLGVAATVASAVDALGASAGVEFRPVPGLEPLEFCVARRAGDDRAEVTALIDAAVEAFAEH